MSVLVLWLAIAPSTLVAGTALPGMVSDNSDGVDIVRRAGHFGIPPTTVGAPVIEMPFATILHYGNIEGTNGASQLLYRKFHFGWQLLRVSAGGGLRSCDLRASGVPDTSIERLLARAPKPEAREACGPALSFRVPTADEETLRATRTDNVAIPSVRIVDGYAIIDWYGAGGGETIYAKRNQRWALINSGGGFFNACDLASYGVPRSVAAKLQPGSPCT